MARTLSWCAACSRPCALASAACAASSAFWAACVSASACCRFAANTTAEMESAIALRQTDKRTFFLDMCLSLERHQAGQDYHQLVALTVSAHRRSLRRSAYHSSSAVWMLAARVRIVSLALRLRAACRVLLGTRLRRVRRTLLRTRLGGMRRALLRMRLGMGAGCPLLRMRRRRTRRTLRVGRLRRACLMLLRASLVRLRLMLLALRVATRLGAARLPVRLGWLATPRRLACAARRRGAAVSGRERVAVALRERPTVGSGGGGDAARRDDALAGEHSGVRRGGNRGVAAVDRGAHRIVLRGHGLVLALRLRRLRVRLVRRGALRRGGLRGDTTRAAVEAGVIHGGVVHHRGVVDVGDVGGRYVGHGTVVVELSAPPLAAAESHAAVAEAVVDAAVEADMRTPIAPVPGVDAARPAPIAGCPQQADRRQHPGFGHPVVAPVPRPVAGRPDVAWSRERWLHIHRQHGE